LRWWQRNLTSETHQAVATSAGYVLDTGSSAACGFFHDQPIELDLRELELTDCDFLSGCVRPRVMRL
jgi:hypothetical protein